MLTLARNRLSLSGRPFASAKVTYARSSAKPRPATVAGAIVSLDERPEETSAVSPHEGVAAKGSARSRASSRACPHAVDSAMVPVAERPEEASVATPHGGVVPRGSAGSVRGLMSSYVARTSLRNGCWCRTFCMSCLRKSLPRPYAFVPPKSLSDVDRFESLGKSRGSDTEQRQTATGLPHINANAGDAIGVSIVSSGRRVDSFADSPEAAGWAPLICLPFCG